MTTPTASTFASQLPRIITGLALAALLVGSLVLGGPYLAVALAVVSALALYEFFQMFWPGTTRLCSKIFTIAMGAMLFCPVGGDAATLVVMVLVLLVAAVGFLTDYGRGNANARLEDYAILPLGLLYIPVVLHLALGLSLKEQFLVVAVAAASDTAAYYTGCAFGRHKIWPTVSPKKSWEGSLGGFIAAVAVTTGIACLPYGGASLYGGSWLLWLIIGAVLAVAAQVGDFFESALKRACNVKDSSALLPGHGGILDRLDSILFALAAYCVIRLILEHAAGLAARFTAA